MKLILITFLLATALICCLLGAEAEVGGDERSEGRQLRKRELAHWFHGDNPTHKTLPGNTQRGRTSRRRLPRLRTPGKAIQNLGMLVSTTEMLSWTRTVDGMPDVVERAIFEGDRATVMLMSMDYKLSAVNITQSMSLYHFNTSMDAVKTEVNNTQVCILLPISILNASFSDINIALHARNGSTNVATQDTGSYTVDDSGELTPEQTERFRLSHLDAFCGSGTPIFNTTMDTGDSAPSSNRDMVTVLTLGGKTTIYLK